MRFSVLSILVFAAGVGLAFGQTVTSSATPEPCDFAFAESYRQPDKISPNPDERRTDRADQ